MTCLVKTYSVNELVSFFDDESDQELLHTEYVAIVGITPPDEEKFGAVYEQVGDNLKYVCIDVANGYSERFCDCKTI